jgi:hypothetical protein
VARGLRVGGGGSGAAGTSSFSRTALAGLHHLVLVAGIGFIPLLMVAIVLGQFVLWSTRATHNEAVAIGLMLSLYVTPILLRPASDFMRRNMTHWRPEAVGSLSHQRFRLVTLVGALAILPWLLLRFGLEKLLLALSTMRVETAFWASAAFAGYFALLFMWRLAPHVKRLVYPELFAADLSRAAGAAPEVADGGAAVHRGLVDIAELAKRRLDITRGNLVRQDEGVDADARQEGDLIAEIMPADANLALVPEPRPQ